MSQTCLRTLRSLAPVFVAAMLLFMLPAMLTLLGKNASAQSYPAVQVYGDVSRLPQRADVRLAPLPASDPSVRVSSERAVATALTEFGLNNDQLDTNTGIVRARITTRGGQALQGVNVLMVVARQATTGHIPTEHCRKLNIAIDATTGYYMFAYTTDCYSDPAPTAP